jgi:hypothetical protein
MSRLKIKANTAGRQVLGTTFNLTDAEHRRLKLGAFVDADFPSQVLG